MIIYITNKIYPGNPPLYALWISTKDGIYFFSSTEPKLISDSKNTPNLNKSHESITWINFYGAFNLENV